MWNNFFKNKFFDLFSCDLNYYICKILCLLNRVIFVVCSVSFTFMQMLPHYLRKILLYNFEDYIFSYIQRYFLYFDIIISHIIGNHCVCIKHFYLKTIFLVDLFCHQIHDVNLIWLKYVRNINKSVKISMYVRWHCWSLVGVFDFSSLCLF